MSEDEEIIKECNKLLVTLSLHHIDGRIIQALLDLYNHEKATSHHLQNELDKANAKIIELNKKIQDKITEIKNKPIEDEDMLITASQAKVDIVIALESILEEGTNEVK